eukprot:1591137-Rhodomonas_salina.1
MAVPRVSSHTLPSIPPLAPLYKLVPLATASNQMRHICQSVPKYRRPARRRPGDARGSYSRYPGRLLRTLVPDREPPLKLPVPGGGVTEPKPRILLNLTTRVPGYPDIPGTPGTRSRYCTFSKPPRAQAWYGRSTSTRYRGRNPTEYPGTRVHLCTKGTTSAWELVAVYKWESRTA